MAASDAAFLKADPRLKPLRWPLRLTRAGMIAEQLLRALWPAASVLMLALAAVMLGLHDELPVELVWSGAVLSALALGLALIWGIRRFSWPSHASALARLDATLPGRPVSALLDSQAIGASDPASAALWQAHQRRMATAARQARAPSPNLKIAAADPFALRYMALLALVVALVFGSFWRVSSLSGMTPGAASAMNGPTWEGWIAPPRYTGLPVLYLNDQPTGELTLPEGSQITLRFYGEIGALTLDETVSARTGELPPATDPQQEFEVRQEGQLAIAGQGGRDWLVSVTPDAPPAVAVAGAPDLGPEGALNLPFAAQDDYGVVGGTVRISLDLAALDRRHGLQIDPDPREDIVLDLPLPLTGGRSDFTERLIEDFSQHPWANLPVTYTFTAQDAAGQNGTAAPFGAPLTARRFFDPLAASVAEQRRDILWARANAPRVAQILRAVSHRPDGIFRDAGSYLRLRGILRRLESHLAAGALTSPAQEDIAAALWDLAIALEEGDVGDALERMKRAQERLSQAMREGASDQEIARLMQELREATDDYLRQLQRQAEQNGEMMEPGEMPEDMMQLSQDDLQAMMDRIQELMEQGRMAEAEQALREFQQMMENMRMTRGQQGQQGGDQGRQAMEGLAETLREQQGLSDQAFRDLQEQFNSDAQRGQSQGNEGRNGGQGRGQSHDGTGGTGEGGEQSGQQQGGGGDPGQSQPGQGGSGADGNPSAGDLAQRQQALRNELERQRDGLPFGGEEGRNARDALDRAGRAMEGAEESLRNGDLAEAIDQQSDAMEALREGMRSLGEAMAQRQQPGQNQGQQGQAQPNGSAEGLDPLGRASGMDNGDRGAVPDRGSAHGRAWDLLEEIRRRSQDRSRSEEERNYLQRLFDRF
ncbi:TIGR02302 family protein [Phaeobacter gallaeciensis]|uniref:TIGR02302 family protein n=1 Tax=Phaeobacter gallaeciensis TaxID=60890 RepID=UPI0023808900|nr:TIGR02302 family protein [Phaeobacter gallaeciensis]MDE4273662.1 TIGR02302 family protein [Phaeobacter gallaeciensis]MDE4298902.1 TIGR02302 family protein [Phaeobacter gallaeciensis]MDE5183648.1 TIGR02302 family protein [Phaeobacter gallaeciensis]